MLGYLMTTKCWADVCTQQSAGSHGRDAHVRRRQLYPDKFCFACGKCVACCRELDQLKSRRQTIVTTSTEQAEFGEAADAHIQGRNEMLLQSDVKQKVENTPYSATALSMVADKAKLSWRTRHLSNCGQLLHPAALGATVSTMYIGTADQRADSMTKDLPRSFTTPRRYPESPGP